MTEVRSALGTRHFQAVHAECVVVFRFHVRGDGRIPEARPTGFRVEFRVGFEQLLPADDADVRALRLVVEILPTTGRLGAFEEADIVLLRREFFLCFSLIHGGFQHTTKIVGRSV